MDVKLKHSKKFMFASCSTLYTLDPKLRALTLSCSFAGVGVVF